MPDNKPPKPPPANRNRKGIVQRDAELRSAKKATRKNSPKEVLPSRQAREPSDNAELAAGETPLTSPMKKTAIDLKMTVQILPEWRGPSAPPEKPGVLPPHPLKRNLRVLFFRPPPPFQNE